MALPRSVGLRLGTVTPEAPPAPVEVDRPAPGGRKCGVCSHPHRDAIERLHNDERAPSYIRDYMIRHNWGPEITLVQLKNHFGKCLAKRVQKAGYTDRSAQAFVEAIERLRDKIEAYLDEFEDGAHVCSRCREPDEALRSGGKDWKAATGLLRELREVLTLHGKTLGHLRPDVEVTVINNPQFLAVVDPICEITAACANCGPRVERVLESGSVS